MGRRTQLECRLVELGGVRYAIVKESELRGVCRRAEVELRAPTEAAALVDADMDDASLAARLVERRRAAGLTQAELARRAGVRVETLNRIERGKTTPDFATIRKLVVAMDAVEAEASSIAPRRSGGGRK